MSRAPIREERLRATAGLRQDMALSSWRGRSGRRYVVGVHEPGEAELAELTDAVVLAVERGLDGTAALVEAAPGAGMPRGSRLRWLARMRRRGATEIHVHRLAESAEERRAMLEDLALAAAG